MALDIPAIIRSGVATAFSTAESIWDAGTYYKVTSGTYNPADGTSPHTTTGTAVKAIFGMFHQREIDGQQVQSGDKKIFIRQTDLAVEPQRNDYYVDANAVRWDVELIHIEPTRSLWILRGRAHRK